MITMMNRLNAIAGVAKLLWMVRRDVTRVVILSMMFSLANIYPCMNAAKVAIPTAAVRTDQTISNAVASVISSMVGLIANMIYFSSSALKNTWSSRCFLCHFAVAVHSLLFRYLFTWAYMFSAA